MKTTSYLFAIIIILISLIGAVEAVYTGKTFGIIMCIALLFVGWGFINNVEEEEEL